jgi:hypothetical protein
VNAAPAPGYGTVDLEYGARLATTPADEDGPIWMVNLMKYHDRARYADGTDHGLTGREADDRYAPIDVLTDIGAEVVFVGDVDRQLLGEAPVWDRVGVVKYPTRRSFVEMQSRPDVRARHVHKDAGMQETFVIGCLPMTVPAAPDRPDWSAVPHPPSDEDGPVVVLHVLRYADAGAAHLTPEEMEAYTAAAARVAVPNGARIHGWFTAEGTIVGDGRTWDQVRFNAFPSRRAFMAVVTDPDRLAAQRAHREPAIADTYTMIIRPRIDRLAESIC